MQVIDIIDASFHENGNDEIRIETPLDNLPALSTGTAEFIQAISTNELMAVQACFLAKRDFGPGHLSRVGHLTIGALLKYDAKRVLPPPLLGNIDAHLCEFFGCKIGKKILL